MHLWWSNRHHLRLAIHHLWLHYRLHHVSARLSLGGGNQLRLSLMGMSGDLVELGLDLERLPLDRLGAHCRVECCNVLGELVLRDVALGLFMSNITIGEHLSQTNLLAASRIANIKRHILSLNFELRIRSMV